MATTPATSAPVEAPKPAVKTNRIGLQVLDYRGGKTTLCAGCGHNAISERIIDAFYEMGVQPERLMKLSGIGCSSKSPAYFMSRSHSFNSVPRRMPSVANDLPPIDTCALAIQLGATFVGRSFSGDKKQLLAMLKAAIAHNGTVVLDVISPCVTFNDHEGSTRSYKYMQEHEEAISEVGFVPHFQEIDVEYDPGTTINVEMNNGRHMSLRKLHENFNPPDRIAAISALMAAHANEEVLTGVFYVDTQKPSFTDMLNLVEEPIGTLPEDRVRPSRAVLDDVMQRLM